MKMKYFVSLLFAAILSAFVGMSALAASTSLALSSVSLAQMVADNDPVGSNPPYSKEYFPEEYIEPLGGSLSLTENLLHLPGKNGLDVNITLKYNNQLFEDSYCRSSEAEKDCIYEAPAFYYTYESNGQTKEILIAFESQDEMLEKAPVSFEATKLPTEYRDYNDVEYYRYSSFVNGSGMVFTRSASRKPTYICVTATNYIVLGGANYKRLPIGDMWHMQMPMLMDAVVLAPIDSDETYTYYECTDMLTDYDGNYADVTITYKKRKKGSVIVNSGISIRNATGKYTGWYDRDVGIIEDDKRGAYICYITDSEGRTMYFNKTGFMTAIEDRFGNIVQYAYEDSKLTKIVDTYGRILTFEYGADEANIYIQMPDGKKTLAAKIAASYDNNAHYDPNDYLYADNDYSSEITKYDTSGDNYTKSFRYQKRDTLYFTQTTYGAKYHEILDNVTEITQPNNVKTVYNYEVFKFTPSYSQRSHCVTERHDIYGGKELNKYTYSYTPGTQTVCTPGDGNDVTTYKGSKYLSSKTVSNGTDSYTDSYSYTSGGARKVLGGTARTYKSKGVTSESRRESTAFLNFRPKKIYYDNYENKITYFDDSNFVKSSVYNSDKNKTKLVKTEYELSAEGDDYYKGRTIDRAIISESDDGSNFSEKYAIEYTYNADGTLAGETFDPDGINRVTEYTYSYPADGGTVIYTKLKNVVDADGKSANMTSSVKMDYLGRVIMEMDRSGNEIYYEYDVYGRPTKITYSNGDSVTYEYDTAANTTIYTDENSIKTKAVYDGFGNLLAAYKNNGTASSPKWIKTQEYSYDSIERPLDIKEYTGYSGATATKWIKTSFSYGPFDNISEKTVTDQSGAVLTHEAYEYNFASAMPFLSKHDTTNGYRKKQFTYVTVKTDPADGITPPTVEQYYDRRGRLCKQIRTDGSDKYYSTYIYDELNNVLEEKDERAYDELDVDYSAKYEYDNFGNVISVYNADGNLAAREYDITGNILKETDFEGNSVTYTYDKLGRMLTKSAPIDQTTSFEKYYYTPTDCLSKVVIKGASGSRSLTYSYDSRGRLLQAFDGIAYTKNVYTGNLLSKTASGLTSDSTAMTQLEPSNSQYTVTAYTYDKFGNVAAEESYDGKKTYTYDLAGNVLTVKDANNTQTTNTYDSRRNLITSNAGGDVIKHTYNSFGMPTSVGRGSNTSSYEYDNFGRVVRETQNDAELEWEYNAAGQPTRFRLTQDGEVKQDTAYTYDALGNMASAESGDDSAVYTYNPNGLPTEEVYGNGLSTVYEYGAGNVIKSVKNRKAKIGEDGYDEVSGFEYSYAPDGNVAKVTDSRLGYATYVTSYTYDNGNRLKKAVMAKTNGTAVRSWEYTYDQNGNMTKKTENTGDAVNTTTYAYSGHRLTKETTNGISTEYRYDANGNVLEKLNDSVTYSYTYTPRNEVSSVSIGGKNAGKYTYTYDASSLRRSVSDGSETKTYTWSGDNIVSETSDISDRRVDYFYGVKRVSRKIRGTHYEGTYSENRESHKVDNYRDYYLYDGRGNVVQLADVELSEHLSVAINKKSEYYPELEFSGDDRIDLSDYMTVLNSYPATRTYYYSPFGEIWQGENSCDTNPYRYSGEFYDKETGSIYLRARYYDPDIGRFITVDPAKDGTNWYVYCANNPIAFVDPSGHEKEGDERFSQTVRDQIEIYSQIWLDAETAYEIGIIQYDEKVAVQNYAERNADEIRYRADHPIETGLEDVTEFLIFDMILGDLDGGTVYAADLSVPALEKMYGNQENLKAIVDAAPVAAAEAVGSSSKGRTLVNTKIKGKMTRVDIEFPQGGKPANLHVQIKGTGQKVMIESLDDLDKLPKAVSKNKTIIKAVKKGLKLIGKFF